MRANCTCTLIKGPNNVIIDTMTAWDREKIVSGNEWQSPLLGFCVKYVLIVFVVERPVNFIQNEMLFFMKLDDIVILSLYVNDNAC